MPREKKRTSRKTQGSLRNTITSLCWKAATPRIHCHQIFQRMCRAENNVVAVVLLWYASVHYDLYIHQLYYPLFWIPLLSNNDDHCDDE